MEADRGEKSGYRGPRARTWRTVLPVAPQYPGRWAARPDFRCLHQGRRDEPGGGLRQPGRHGDAPREHRRTYGTPRARLRRGAGGGAGRGDRDRLPGRPNGALRNRRPRVREGTRRAPGAPTVMLVGPRRVAAAALGFSFVLADAVPALA